MKLYHLHRKQFLPITLERAWDFFSSPKNLGVITPSHMNFKIIEISGDRIYTGQIIRYKVQVLPLWKVNWITEITDVNEPYSFADEQRKGPYAIWKHVHNFKEVKSGVEMNDDLTYAIPYGIIGRLANAVFVEREVNGIFDYRHKVLETYFNEPKSEMRIAN
jgi:ligand-binding SRPBCC domain-containing protein